MSLYYVKKEIEGLEIVVKDAKSDFTFETGHNFRVRYKYKDDDILYATICKFYGGIWYITANPQNFFPYINSNEIEKRRSLENIQGLYSWGKYFIHQLEKINFFYSGLWHMDFYLPSQKEKKFICISSSSPIFDFEKTFDFNDYRYLDWYGEDNGMILNIKEQQDDNSSRVKFYRKKVLDGSLPPILLQFIPTLDAFIILDGHCRYKASLLEGILPKLIVVNGVKKIIVKEDEQRKQKVLEGIEKNKNKINVSKRMGVKKLNDLLINIYGDKEFYTSHFKGKAVFNFNEKWQNIIENRLDGYEDLENILQRKEY
ncbi:hypothetical protein [Arcobacter sp. CECT 8985]|uniref:hypothetical protein n=1 Tax=Arcobacter sp. CECT 8985 TaxID=1935424 RepID=UPI00100B4844|nr:hypothetical protein [Arcobacter sp. CECT 8985]RXJ87325.1 hypothetical protein CRU93_04300 [Arcobacter sp. CECT 8985]